MTYPPDRTHAVLGIVSGEGYSVDGIFSGKASLDKALAECLDDLRDRAAALGADAVAGVTFHIETRTGAVTRQEGVQVIGIDTAIRWR